MGDNSKDVKFNYPKEYVDIDKPKMECNHKFRQECKLCGIIKVGSIYPHNMPETPWRKELAKDLAAAIISNPWLMEEKSKIAMDLAKGDDKKAKRLMLKEIAAMAYLQADALIEKGKKHD